MRCCGYQFKSESVNAKQFTLPISIPETDLPLVFSFTPSVNTTPALVGELFEPGTLMFLGIRHDRVDKDMRYIGVAMFERKGKKASDRFIAADSKSWVTLLPVLFQE